MGPNSGYHQAILRVCAIQRSRRGHYRYVLASGLRGSLRGPYYKTALIDINTEYFGVAVSEDTVTLLRELGHVMNYLSAGFGSRDSFIQFDSWRTKDNKYNTDLVRKCTDRIDFTKEPGKMIIFNNSGL